MRCYAPAQLITERRSWRRFDNRLHTYSITPNPNERFRIPSGLAKEVRALSGTRRTRIPVFDRRPIPRQAWSRPGKTPPNSLCRAVSSGRLTKLRLLAALVGALVHVFNHPGTNNGHEARARTRTERARTHMDSVLIRLPAQSAHRSPPNLVITDALFAWLPTEEPDREDLFEDRHRVCDPQRARAFPHQESCMHERAGGGRRA